MAAGVRRLLVVGESGQLAHAIAECAAEFHGLAIAFISRPEIDLLKIDDACSRLRAMPFDVLLNATAFNDVDGAESDDRAAIAINADAPGRLAGVAAERGAPFVHFSTDYVFAGDAAPYREDKPTGPLSKYGRSKLAGEHRVTTANPRHLIFRTAWLFSPWGRNFATTILRLAGKRDELRIVADQHGNPTNALDLARATLSVVGGIGSDDVRYGTYHLAGEEAASRFEFTEALVAASRELGGPACKVLPIAAADYPTPAPRPADSRLDCQRVLRAFGVGVPGYRASLAATVERILKSRNG